MDNSMLLPVAGTLIIVAIAVISATAYNHKGEHYKEGRQPTSSIGHFRFVYRWLQLSSIGIGITSFWSDAAWLLEVHHEPWLSWAGLGTAVLATWMFVSSKRALGTNYSPCFDAHAPAEIVSNGPYRRIRHPIYTANIGLLAALAVATGSLWVLANAGILAVYYSISAVREEAELKGLLEGYDSYYARTGRFLPRLTSGGHHNP